MRSSRKCNTEMENAEYWISVDRDKDVLVKRYINDNIGKDILFLNLLFLFPIQCYDIIL